MNQTDVNPIPKVHPASREILPDDPMEMQGFEIPGNPQLMLQLLVEEYARIGMGVDQIVQLAHDPNYTAFYGLRRSLGNEEFDRRVRAIVLRCGVMRVKATEQPLAEQLVQIELPV
jgi:hypothetical protein